MLCKVSKSSRRKIVTFSDNMNFIVLLCRYQIKPVLWIKTPLPENCFYHRKCTFFMGNGYCRIVGSRKFVKDLHSLKAKLVIFSLQFFPRLEKSWPSCALFRQMLFWTGNQDNHQNFHPSLLPYNWFPWGWSIKIQNTTEDNLSGLHGICKTFPEN